MNHNNLNKGVWNQKTFKKIPHICKLKSLGCPPLFFWWLAAWEGSKGKQSKQPERLFYKSPNAASPFQFQCGQWRDDVLWWVIISSHVAFFNRICGGFFPSFLRLYKTSQVPQERKHAGVECSSARFQHLLPNGFCGVFHKRRETTGCRRDRGVTWEFYGLLLEQDLQHCCP